MPHANPLVDHGLVMNNNNYYHKLIIDKCLKVSSIISTVVSRKGIPHADPLVDHQ